jgi:CheY-like chemotaxis protein
MILAPRSQEITISTNLKRYPIPSMQNRKRILLVDDEPDTCMVYQIILEDAGFECLSYTDSVKALQEFRPNYHDLILLDIRMPVLKGFEL